jgi:ABC-type antimicrobial peptide transport system permease subunit
VGSLTFASCNPLHAARLGLRPAQDPWRTIVGVVPTIKHGSPQDGYENAVVYIPFRQETPGAVSLLVRDVLWGSGMIVITPGDPMTYVAITTILSLVSIAASLLPARRATRIDPVIALRAE